MVLECSLDSVTTRFRTRLALLKPMIELLLRETSAKPNVSMLRRMLVLKKSLVAFHASVKAVSGAVNGLFEADVNFFGGGRSADDDLDAEGVDLMLGAYSSDLKEIESELKMVSEGLAERLVGVSGQRDR